MTTINAAKPNGWPTPEYRSLLKAHPRVTEADAWKVAGVLVNRMAVAMPAHMRREIVVATYRALWWEMPASTLRGLLEVGKS